MGRIKINPNERSWGINLISIINQFTNRHDLIIDNAGGNSQFFLVNNACFLM